MKTTLRTLFLLPALFVALPATADETLRYAEPAGGVQTVEVESVSKFDENEIRVQVRIGGRKRRITIPARLIVDFRRGDSSDINQWAKRLAHGKRLMAAGQLATQGTVPGAEETFVKVAYSTWEGSTKAEKEAEGVLPWHNMYATYYLIECRYLMGKSGETGKLEEALKTIEEFRKRSETRSGRSVKLMVPGEKGQTFEDEVFGWDDNWLSPWVDLYEARIHHAMGQKDKAKQVYEAVIDQAKNKLLSPGLLTTAVIEKAAMEAEGQASDQQENLFRSAGNLLSTLAGQQPDEYGKDVLRRAANRALLRGADLLLESAAGGKITYDLPLSRYRSLLDNEGRNDDRLRFGAMAGIGICLTEKGEGEEAYKTLLDVVVQGYEYPEQMARALYYLGKAAPQYASEIENAGGKADFLRAEGARWWEDLRQRYPTSEWAKKAQSQ